MRATAYHAQHRGEAARVHLVVRCVLLPDAWHPPPLERLHAHAGEWTSGSPNSASWQQCRLGVSLYGACRCALAA
jgi:hypothetical protein